MYDSQTIMITCSCRVGTGRRRARTTWTTEGRCWSRFNLSCYERVRLPKTRHTPMLACGGVRLVASRTSDISRVAFEFLT